MATPAGSKAISLAFPSNLPIRGKFRGPLHQLAIAGDRPRNRRIKDEAAGIAVRRDGRDLGLGDGGYAFRRWREGWERHGIVVAGFQIHGRGVQHFMRDLKIGVDSFATVLQECVSDGLEVGDVGLIPQGQSFESSEGIDVIQNPSPIDTVRQHVIGFICHGFDDGIMNENVIQVQLHDQPKEVL